MTESLPSGNLDVGVHITSEVSDEAYTYVCRHLFAYNVDVTNGLLREPDVVVRLVLIDADDQVMGGIFCDTFLRCLYIDVLWVDERLRGQSYGRQLMEEAERIARANGCTFAHTTTFSYQAPGFYQRLGYQVFGVLDDYPNGIKQYFLKKRL